MKDASNLSHFSRKLLQCMHVATPYTGHVVEVAFQNHRNMICSLIQHGFLPVFSTVGKIMLYFIYIYIVMLLLVSSDYNQKFSMCTFNLAMVNITLMMSPLMASSKSRVLPLKAMSRESNKNGYSSLWESTNKKTTLRFSE